MESHQNSQKSGMAFWHMAVACVGGAMVEPPHWGAAFHDWEGHSAALVGLTLFGLAFSRDAENQGWSIECPPPSPPGREIRGLPRCVSLGAAGWSAPGTLSLGEHITLRPFMGLRSVNQKSRSMGVFQMRGWEVVSGLGGRSSGTRGQDIRTWKEEHVLEEVWCLHSWLAFHMLPAK